MCSALHFSDRQPDRHALFCVVYAVILMCFFVVICEAFGEKRGERLLLYYNSKTISPEFSSTGTGYTSAGFGSPAMGFPIIGNVGTLGHHSPNAAPVFKSNSIVLIKM